MTKIPSLPDNIAGAERRPGARSAALQPSERLPFKHPDSSRAEKETKAPTLAPAELLTSPKLDLTFLYLLNLNALVREGQKGGWDLRVRGVQKEDGGVRGVECHKATAVQGCLSLQGSTPLLSW